MKRLSVILLLLLMAGCAGLNYSQMSDEAKDFHPRTIAILPAAVGEHESARDEIDNIVYNKLLIGGWFTNVIDAEAVKAKVKSSDELSNLINAYTQKLNSFGVSDPELLAKFRDTFTVEAILLPSVTSWGYGRMEGNKVARVGMGIKLIDTSKGTIIWKANHELVEDYLAIKPKLGKMADELMGLFMKEMPH